MPQGVVSGYLDIWRRVVEGTNFRAGRAMVARSSETLALVAAQLG